MTANHRETAYRFFHHFIAKLVYFIDNFMFHTIGGWLWNEVGLQADLFKKAMLKNVSDLPLVCRSE